MGVEVEPIPAEVLEGTLQAGLDLRRRTAPDDVCLARAAAAVIADGWALVAILHPAQQSIKLGAVPLLATLWVWLGPAVTPLVATALMIQAASPPATNLVIIAEHYDGDVDTVGATLVVTYALSMLMFVVWLGLAL